MRQEKIKAWLSQYGASVLVMVLGAILLVKPDSASILISKIIGWVLIVLGALTLISNGTGAVSTPSGWITGGIMVVGGIVIVSNPLLLAVVIFRCVGMLIAVKGFLDVRMNRQLGISHPPVPIATLVLGIVLALVPLRISRLVMRIVGLVVLILGVVNTLNQRKRLPDGVKPKVIDADL